MKIVIITRPENRSPKVLAYSLRNMLSSNGVECDIIENIDFLRRLLPIYKKPTRWNKYLHRRLEDKIRFLKKDNELIARCKQADAVIISECIPNAYWKNYYALTELKKKIAGKPFGLLEVFYLNSAPHFREKLLDAGDNVEDIFDFQLAVTDKSYVPAVLGPTMFTVGLDLASFTLKPTPKVKFRVLVDFEWDGSEAIRKEQIDVLEKLGIEYTVLKGEYTPAELRKLYSESSVFLIQHFESFGLPIAECLATGTHIMTANAGWPIAFRLNPSAGIYKESELPSCFSVYTDGADLEQKLRGLQKENQSVFYQKNFDVFQENFPTYYTGNLHELKNFLSFLSKFNEGR